MTGVVPVGPRQGNKEIPTVEKVNSTFRELEYSGNSSSSAHERLNAGFILSGASQKTMNVGTDDSVKSLLNSLTSCSASQTCPPPENGTLFELVVCTSIGRAQGHA
mmetsp:Transcript_3762/g.9485  ORF Transcript_3762/g.9485 Transcript_3762/m.9485 type:complete len:106 (+) Transcript_3762:182-499(+)